MFSLPRDTSDEGAMYICDSSGNEIDNVDAAKKVSIVTTKEDLG